mmetsp:Transcript_572/g.1813  ORF Transcript_572/g.1813 Transcript_572/m.1813 type:complete len:301 (+) Transcript_572:1017-1919(+)
MSDASESESSVIQGSRSLSSDSASLSSSEESGAAQDVWTRATSRSTLKSDSAASRSNGCPTPRAFAMTVDRKAHNAEDAASSAPGARCVMPARLAIHRIDRRMAHCGDEPSSGAASHHVIGRRRHTTAGAVCASSEFVTSGGAGCVDAVDAETSPAQAQPACGRPVPATLSKPHILIASSMSHGHTTVALRQSHATIKAELKTPVRNFSAAFRSTVAARSVIRGRRNDSTTLRASALSSRTSGADHACTPQVPTSSASNGPAKNERWLLSIWALRTFLNCIVTSASSGGHRTLNPSHFSS